MIYKSKNGKWVAKDVPRDVNPTYAKSLVQYLNSLDLLFCKAQKKSDFEFILTLLNIQGARDVGWNPFETTQDIFETFNKLKTKIKYNDEQLHLFLVLHGLILEASNFYDLLYNLLKVISGDRYSAFCFPDIKLGQGSKTRPMSVSEKIIKIQTLAKKLGLDENIKLLKDIFDKDLRNAIFHSDYCLYGEELRIQKPAKVYQVSDVMKLINKTIAYYETLEKLVEYHRASYTESRVIDAHPKFSNDPDEKAVVMVRKGTGVVGVKDNWTEEQIKRGKIPYNLCRILPYEQKMISKNPFISEFPPNKITRINKVLRLFPIPIRKHLLKFSDRLL